MSNGGILIIFAAIILLFMIKQAVILFGCWLAGMAIQQFLVPQIPGSIFGMLLLTAGLELKIFRLEEVATISDFFVRNMAFFFIPPGVGIMLYFDLIKAEWLPIIIGAVFSTFVVLAVVGWIFQKGGSNE